MQNWELYLVLPDAFEAARHHHALTDAIALGAPSALRLATTDATRAREQVNALKPLLHTHDIALMLTDLPALARDLDCDGVHITAGSPLLSSAREALGEERQLGIACDANRDAAMQAGEAGADYIALPPNAADILKWWGSVMELPTVAEGLDTAEACQAAIEAGADFLCITLDLDEGAAHSLAMLPQP